MIYWIHVTGILLCCFVMFSNRKGLAGYFIPLVVTILLHIFALGHSILFLGGSEWTLAVMFINLSPLFYLLGPLIFWYTNRVLTDMPSYNKSQLWHVVPFFLFFLITLPYILSPFEYKLTVARSLMNDISLLQTLQVGEALPSSINILIRPLHILTYCIVCVVQLRRYFQHTDSLPVTAYLTQASRVCRGLYQLIFVILANVVLYYLVSFMWMEEGHTLVRTPIISVLFGLSAISMVSIPVYYLIYPEISYGIPRLQKEGLSSPESIQYFSPENQAELENVMEKMLSQAGPQNQQQVYLPEKTLLKLSGEWKLPVHYLRFCQKFLRPETYRQ